VTGKVRDLGMTYEIGYSKSTNDRE
jgi:hypothetical protein